MSTQQRRSLACTALLVAAIATPGADQEPSNARQRAGNDDNGVAALTEIAAGRSALSVPDQIVLVQRGIDDTDVEVRAAALSAIFVRAAAVRFASTDSPTGQAIGESEFPQLRPFVVAALTDESAKVRLAALMALGNMELSRPADRYDRQRLNVDASRLLYQMFNAETDRTIRFQIVKAFALSGESSNETRDVIARTLNETDDGILQYAIMGVATLEALDLLPRVIDHLQHPNHAIRLAAATSAGHLPAAWGTYRKELEEALAQEKRDEVRQVLRGVLNAAGAFQ